MTRPLRVVVLDHTGQLGGAELALVRLCAAVDPARVELVVVLFSAGPLVARLRALGINVRVLELDRRITTTDRHEAGKSVLGAVGFAAAVVPFVVRLARLLRRLGPDVVHSTSLKADLLALPAAALARRPLVWHVHDRISDDYLPAGLAHVIRVLARRGPAHVVVNSLATARTLLPLSRGWTLAYPGLAPEQLVEDPTLRSEPVPAAVGLVGRVSPTKGQREFVEACALLAPRFPELRFRLIGAALFEEQSYERAVRQLVDELGLGDRVEFTGWVDDTVAEIDRLSVLVHASPTPEPFGQVVAEGMGRGVPVVATRGGGVDEIAVAPDGTNRCTLIEPRDVVGLADAVAALLVDRSAAEARAQRAWADVSTLFGIATTAEAITTAWESVASPARGRAPVSSHGPDRTIEVPRPGRAQRPV